MTKANQYVLTVICILINYVLCIFLPDKTADVVVDSNLKEVYCRFGRSSNISSENDSEFKNKLFSEVAT